MSIKHNYITGPRRQNNKNEQQENEEKDEEKSGSWSVLGLSPCRRCRHVMRNTLHICIHNMGALGAAHLSLVIAQSAPRPDEIFFSFHVRVNSLHLPLRCRVALFSSFQTIDLQWRIEKKR